MIDSLHIIELKKELDKQPGMIVIYYHGMRSIMADEDLISGGFE